MRIKFLLFFLILLSCSTSSGLEFGDNNKPVFQNSAQQEAFNSMLRVYKWQSNHFPQKKYSPNWHAATFYIGAMAAYEITRYEEFLKGTYYWAETNEWKLGHRKFHADDQASAQVYMDLYGLYRKSYMIEYFRNEVEEMIKLKPHLSEPILWWWADALFMAPPALAQLGRATGEDKYLQYMYIKWHETYIHLSMKKIPCL